MDDVVMRIENLSFKYDGQDKLCIEGLNLEIKRADRFGLFGPNGAGKTTLISLMTGLFKPLSGTIYLDGKNVSTDKEVKHIIGFVPQDFAFYAELTPMENLRFFGAWYGLNKSQIEERSFELLSILGLLEVKDKLVKNFSGGMKRRINIAIGVLHRPKVIFLDEPTTGVDAQSRYAINNYLKSLNELGSTIIYTSHQLNEAEGLCRQIALINEGKIVVNNRLEHLLNQYQETSLEGLYIQLTGKGFRD